MNRSLHIGIAALALFAFAGCDTEKKQLMIDLENAKFQIETLSSNLDVAEKNGQEAEHDFQVAKSELAVASVTIDSITKSNESLRGQLSSTKAKYEKSLGEVTRERDDARVMLAFTERERDALLTQVNQLTLREKELLAGLDDANGRLNQIKPWYLYYRHEAERSMWQRFWGTNRGTEPETIEQTFEWFAQHIYIP